MTDELLTPTPQPEEQQQSDLVPPRREYSPFEALLSWASLIMGYLFCRVFPVTEHPLGGLVFILCIFIGGFVILRKNSTRPTPFSYLLFVSAVAVSLSLFLSSNPFLHFFAFSYALAAFALFISSATGNTSARLFSGSLIGDFIKALLLMPFFSFGKLFAALFSGKMKKGGRAALKVLLGIAIALVPTLAVFSLLSYDSGFTRIMGDIFSFNFGDVMSHILSFLCGIPVGMYVFGMFISAFDRTCADMLTEESCKKAVCGLRFLPAATALTAALPLLFVYVVFFVSQWGYYVSGFTGKLPGDMTYAQYAREGFFQLCTVSVINLAVTVALSVFMRRREEKPSKALIAIIVTYALFTIALICTALAKMIMYIDTYGLTPKRVYATWFMCLLAVVFVLVAVGQFAKRLRIVPLAAALTVCFFAALSLCNTDSLIARYNIDRYLAGDLETVDVYALSELGDAVVPEFVRLAEELDAREGTNIKSINRYIYTEENADVYQATVVCLHNAAVRLGSSENDGVFAYTLPKMKALAALDKIGFLD